MWLLRLLVEPFTADRPPAAASEFVPPIELSRHDLVDSYDPAAG
jgi:hypothetical protein